MFKKTLIFGIVLGLMAGLSSGEEKISLELVKEMRFEGGISNVSIASAETISRLRKVYKIAENEPVFPIRAVLDKDRRSVKFISPEGKVEKEIKVGKPQGISILKDGEEILISDGRNYEIKDRKGKTIWEKKSVDQGTALLSPDRSWFVATNPIIQDLFMGYKDLYFYDKEWNLVKHIKTEENFSLASFSPDGSYLIVGLNWTLQAIKKIFLKLQ